MGLLSSIELPLWLMIGEAILIALGFVGLAFTGTRKLRLILIPRLYHPQRCRRCQGCSILQARRATDDPRHRAVAPGALFPGAPTSGTSLIDALHLTTRMVFCISLAIWSTLSRYSTSLTCVAEVC